MWEKMKWNIVSNFEDAVTKNQISSNNTYLMLHVHFLMIWETFLRNGRKYFDENEKKE
jgi:hypothetical protein